MAVGPREAKKEEKRRAEQEAEILEKIIDLKIKKAQYEEEEGMLIIKLPLGVVEMRIAEEELKERYFKAGWKKVEINLESNQEEGRDWWVVRLYYA